MRLVFKFGGTSMAGSERITHAAGLALDAAKSHELVVVVSAMDGVTEQLLDLAATAGDGRGELVQTLLKALRVGHEAVARELGAAAPAQVGSLLDKLDTLAGGILAVGELTPRLADAVVAFGERLSSVMMGVAMRCPALDGQQAGIVTTDHFGEADPLMELSIAGIDQNVRPLLAVGRPVVVAGFIAANQKGVTTTIGRGGSDYTATILGAALKADEIHIWSDVDGLMTADPRVVPSAKLLHTISFAEAIELGKFGAKSMHPRALEPAAAYGVPVRMRSTFKPENPGTLISGGAQVTRAGGSPASAVRAVPMLKNLAMITIGGAGMIGRPGTAAAAFDALAVARVNVHMICQSVSEAGISIVVSQSQVKKARGALERALLHHRPPGYGGVDSVPAISTGSPANADHIINSIEVQEDLVVIAVVGGGMRGTPGVAAKVFTAIAEKSVNIIAIAQGSSELSIALAVQADQAKVAVSAIHEAFGI